MSDSDESDDPYEDIEGEVMPPEADVPPPVCPTCGRPWDSPTYTPGTGNVW